MGINWEFILGLLLPAYAAGHIWLIKVAREDRDLYFLVRRQIRKLCIATIATLLLLMGYVRFVMDIEAIQRDFAVTLGFLAILPMCVTITSLPFFDAVAALRRNEVDSGGQAGSDDQCKPERGK